MQKDVTIYGAGLSGMIAAINLARKGHTVTIHDKEKGYGGSPEHNPSIHMTPILLDKVSEYIGIDISKPFSPLLDFPMYFHDTKIQFPTAATYVVERGDRPNSLDTLLYKTACEEGVNFEFNSPLRKQDVPGLKPGTIIACGLDGDTYEMLGIPHKKVYNWLSRGTIDFDQRTWCWWDESITEYGYMSTANGYYFNLLFSVDKHVSKEALVRYEDFMRRIEGVEHDNWEYMCSSIPVKSPRNPQLTRNGLIMCGTMSGFMDPFVFFGINGAIVSGKIAAMAVDDPDAAISQFKRFSKMYMPMFFFKNYLWGPLVRPQVGLMESAIKLIGPKRLDALMAFFMRENIHLPLLAIPGFSHIGTCYKLKK